VLGTLLLIDVVIAGSSYIKQQVEEKLVGLGHIKLIHIFSFPPAPLFSFAASSFFGTKSS